MMPALEVIVAGLHTTVQDLGRFGYQEVGVPPSGQLDRLSLRQANDLVPLKLADVNVRDEYALSRPLDLALDQPIRVVLGPQADYFTNSAVKTFLSSDYTVSPHADRMGYRLEGTTLAHAKGYNI